MKPRIPSILFASVLFFYEAKSQIDSSETKKDLVQFKIGTFYNSHLNYYGRTDSLRSSGVFPVAELWINETFYLSASPVFVNNASVSFDYAGTVATAGFQFMSDDKKWLTNIYGLKPFYEKGTQLVQSALKGQLAFSLSRFNKIINITGGADVKLSDKVDYGLTAGLDHIYRKQFADKSVLVVDPSAYVFAGTQQFTNTYYKQSNFLLFPGVQQQVSESVKNFNILSYEFSVPVVYAKGKLQVLLTPAYVIPQNLVQVEGRPDLSERAKNMFYATLGAKLTF